MIGRIVPEGIPKIVAAIPVGIIQGEGGDIFVSGEATSAFNGTGSGGLGGSIGLPVAGSTVGFKGNGDTGPAAPRVVGGYV